MEPTRSDHVSDEALAKLGLSRETDLVLDREGRFFAGQQPVEHPGVAAAFARWIERTDAGRYALRNDLHYVYLRVEGAPLHARRAHLAPDPPARVLLELSGGEQVVLRPETLWRDESETFYALGRDGTWAIRIAPSALLDLAEFLGGDEERPTLVLGGLETPIPVGPAPGSRA